MPRKTKQNTQQQLQKEQIQQNLAHIIDQLLSPNTHNQHPQLPPTPWINTLSEKEKNFLLLFLAGETLHNAIEKSQLGPCNSYYTTIKARELLGGLVEHVDIKKIYRYQGLSELILARAIVEIVEDHSITARTRLVAIELGAKLLGLLRDSPPSQVAEIVVEADSTTVAPSSSTNVTGGTIDGADIVTDDAPRPAVAVRARVRTITR